MGLYLVLTIISGLQLQASQLPMAGKINKPSHLQQCLWQNVRIKKADAGIASYLNAERYFGILGPLPFTAKQKPYFLMGDSRLNVFQIIFDLDIFGL